MQPPAGAGVPLLGPALIVGISIGWGLNWPVMKLGLLEFPLWTFRGTSSLAAGLSMLALARMAGGGIVPRRDEWPGLLLAAAFNVTLWQMLVAYGVRLVPSGQAAILAFTMPLWAVALGCLVLRERLGLRGATALALGAAGIGVLISRDLTAIAAAPAGVATVIAGAIAWAVGTLIQKRRRFSFGAMAQAGWQLVLGSIPMIVLVPVFDTAPAAPISGVAWLSWGYTTFLSILLCWYGWFRVIQMMPMSAASIGILLSPPVGVISGALMLGEPVGGREVAALVLIGTALALILLVPSAAAKPASAA
jgi:drug/metabolite transporter (DMT)-like permease